MDFRSDALPQTPCRSSVASRKEPADEAEGHPEVTLGAPRHGCPATQVGREAAFASDRRSEAALAAIALECQYGETGPRCTNSPRDVARAFRETGPRSTKRAQGPGGRRKAEQALEGLERVEKRQGQGSGPSRSDEPVPIQTRAGPQHCRRVRYPAHPLSVGPDAMDTDMQ